MNKSEIKKQVYESNHEARIKKIMIVFDLKVKDDKNNIGQVVWMIENIGVRVREEEISDVVRMRKKEWQELKKKLWISRVIITMDCVEQ